MGPTGVGKTELAFRLSDKVDSQIINVDSVQVYKNLNIGSGKPPKKILNKYPHKLINLIEPWEQYSAANFISDSLDEINKAKNNKKLPLLTGGTMLYFHSLLNGLTAIPEVKESVKVSVSKELKDNGLKALHDRLRLVDPLSAERIHSNDTQRILRAIEVYDSSLKSISQWHREAKKNNNLNLTGFKILQYAIKPLDKIEHRKKVANRFISMIEGGLVKEVETLLSSKEMSKESISMRSVGYRQVCEYIGGEISFDEMIEKGVIATRQLAKRQMTWLRNWENIIWLEEDLDHALSVVMKNIDA